MSDAVATKPKRTRKPKASTAPVVVEAPKCEQCLAEFTWRDRAYTPDDSKLCKRCHQRAERQVLRGRYVSISLKFAPRRPQSLTERLALQGRQFR